MASMYPNRKQAASDLYPIPYLAFASEMETMPSMQNNIRKIRKELGLSMEEVADRSNTTRATIMKLEKGAMNLTTAWIDRIAKALQVSPFTLVTEENAAKVPVLSYVGAGAKVYAIDDHAQGAGLEEVDPPPGFSADGIVALIVRGDSMEPQMENGWLIFYKRESDGVPPDCLGETCVVKLHDDSVLVKKIRQGSKPGLYHLLSKNLLHEPIIDAKVKWASRVIYIMPRRL